MGEDVPFDNEDGGEVLEEEAGDDGTAGQEKEGEDCGYHFLKLHLKNKTTLNNVSYIERDNKPNSGQQKMLVINKTTLPINISEILI